MTDDQGPDDERHDDVVPDGEPRDQELTPLSTEDELWVVAQLRSLPPVEMPRDVQARIEEALAAEARQAPVTPEAAPEWTHGGSGTVVPMRRRAPMGAPLLRAAAGLMLVVGGVVAIGYVGSQLGSSDMDGGDAGSAAAESTVATDAGGGATETVPVYATGTTYTKDSIAQQASALTTTAGEPIDEIVLTSGEAGAPSQQANGDDSSASASASASASRAETDLDPFIYGKGSLAEWPVVIRDAATAPSLPLCVRSLLQPGDTVLAVDTASFDQQPAYIVVGQAADSDRLWYFAVRPTCLDPNTTDAVVLQFGTISGG